MCAYQVEGQSLMETDEQQLDTKEKKKKSHVNRKLQRFKRKCRSRDMTKEQIIELPNSRGNENNVSSDQSSQKSKKPTVRGEKDFVYATSDVRSRRFSLYLFRNNTSIYM